MDLIEELQWRGLLQDITPGTKEQLQKEMTTAYVGFDPTADSLHIGNLVPVTLLMHIQKNGHKPLVLVGGATGRVGDPSGKTAERQLLSIEDIEANLEGQKRQLQRFLNFNDGANKAEIVNNYEWFKDISFLDFIRDTGKHITINYMLAKESVKNRLEGGMSFTEFTYQLIQAYDFWYLWKNRNCKLQMGGSDQWGNITSGTELIRRKSAGEAFAFTAPLVKKADGTKFGKSEGGNIWLDPEKTSPYKFYQFWLNTSDVDAVNFIKIFSFKSIEEIKELISEHEEAPHLRIVQKALAVELTSRIHGEIELQKAEDASSIIFGNDTHENLMRLDERDLLSVFEGVPQKELDKSVLQNPIAINELLAEKTGFLKSNSEARRALAENSIRVNKQLVDETFEVKTKDLINGKYLLLQRGKKNYFLVIFN